MKIYLLILSLLISAGSAYQVSSFQGSLFSQKPASGMYQLEAFSFPTTGGTQLLTYGDFNNDKLTDVAVLNDAQNLVSIYVWSSGASNFVYLTNISTTYNVLNAIPGDFNYDGLTDLLLVSQQTDSAQYFLYLQQTGHTFTSVSQASFSVTPFQNPLVFDKEGDRLLDLLVFTNGARTIYTYNPSTQQFDSNPFSNYVTNSQGCMSYTNVINTGFKVPSSNAFVDLNGDCQADLFLESTSSGNNYVEIWYRLGTQFCLVDYDQIDLVTSIMSFTDFDGNGGIDIVYADTPSSGNINIHILYNQISGSTSSPCGRTSNPAQIPFGGNKWNVNTASKDNYASIYQLPSISGSNNRLFSSDPTNKPARFRIGDINIDGRQDVIIMLGNTAGTSGMPTLLINVADGDQASLAYIPSGSSDYYNLNAGDSPTLNAYQASYASFFDFDEIGNLGFWIQKPATSNTPSSLIGIFNFVSSENFFLKANILNGYFLQGASEINPSLGGIYYGPSIECVVTTVSGGTTLDKGVQLAQSGYNPLDLIYIYIGLGRTNNYVEDFAVGVPASYQQSPQKNTWTPIIPNSQLIVNTILTNTWTLDVYVSPTKETVLVAIVTFLILILLGLLIIVYHKREKDEDKKNQDRILHIFG